MTRNEAYLTVVEGWLRDNRGIVFTEGAVDDLCDRIASVCFTKDRDNARLRAVVVRAKDALLDGQSTQWVHDLLVAALAKEPKP